MTVIQARTFLTSVTVALCCACSGTRDYGVETYPVIGQVYVDGNPVAGVTVTLNATAGMNSETPSVSATTTKDDGTFAVSTFEEGDGVPAGDYVATFAWGEYNMVARSMGPDKFNGKYTDPESSEFKVTVSEGQSADMGRIDLKVE